MNEKNDTYRHGLQWVMTQLANSRITGAAPIGPLFGAGWNGCVDALERAVRAEIGRVEYQSIVIPDRRVEPTAQ